MKTFKLISTMLLIPAAVALTVFGCNEKNELANTNLQGTKWKLAGYVDVATGSMTEPEPLNCETCYTLTFDTDSTLTGFSSANELFGQYKIDYKTNAIHMISIGGTKLAERFNGNLYCETLIKTQSFSFKENKLILHYNNNMNYLLYKSIK